MALRTDHASPRRVLLAFAQPFIDVPRDVGADLFARMDDVIHTLNAISRGTVLWKSLTMSVLVLHIREWRFEYKLDPTHERVVVMTAKRDVV